MRVSKSGNKVWNGQDVDYETLNRYMVELSKMPPEAGNLVIHIEPGARCDIVKGIVEITESNALCHANRCLRDRWNYKRPIVN